MDRPGPTGGRRGLNYPDVARRAAGQAHDCDGVGALPFCRGAAPSESVVRQIDRIARRELVPRPQALQGQVVEVTYRLHIYLQPTSFCGRALGAPPSREVSIEDYRSVLRVVRGDGRPACAIQENPERPRRRWLLAERNGAHIGHAVGEPGQQLPGDRDRRKVESGSHRIPLRARCDKPEVRPLRVRPIPLSRVNAVVVVWRLIHRLPDNPTTA
jgi:hypothetical protein